MCSVRRPWRKKKPIFLRISALNNPPSITSRILRACCLPRWADGRKTITFSLLSLHLLSPQGRATILPSGCENGISNVALLSDWSENAITILRREFSPSLTHLILPPAAAPPPLLSPGRPTAGSRKEGGRRMMRRVARSSEVENALACQRCCIRQSQVICWFHWSFALAILQRCHHDHSTVISYI